MTLLGSRCSLRKPWVGRILLEILSMTALLALPTRIDAIAGIEGTFEYAIDAPWRIEPSVGPDGKLEHGAVPIQLSVHDAMLSTEDSGDRLGRVCEIWVHERGQPAPVREELEEVELTIGVWPLLGLLPDSAHRLCRAWQDEDCSGFERISETSEWHGLAFFDLSGDYEPGSYASLDVRVKVSRDAEVSCQEVPETDWINLRNHLRILLAADPLPRFGSGWLYGDLHYHSQGTDNEGESAYNYRGVVRAMGAMGVDFVFATEHASNSAQFVDGDVSLSDGIDEYDFGLRDMSADRFFFNSLLLHRSDGVNREAALHAGSERLPQNLLSHDVVPQIFLGGEVDLIPETDGFDPDPFDPERPGLQFGNHKFWPLDSLCGGYEPLLEPILGSSCVLGDLVRLSNTLPLAILIRDNMAINYLDFARHHIVYLPDSASDRFAFVGSNTGRYGGAARRWVADLQSEIEFRGGYAFLAHPFQAPRRGSPAPDDLPWSDHEFRAVWASPAILGLQFWNEDTRLTEVVDVWQVDNDGDASAGDDVGYERNDAIVVESEDGARIPNNNRRGGFDTGEYELRVQAPIEGTWDLAGGTSVSPIENVGITRYLADGMYTWDRLNQWGLNVQLTETLPWLAGFRPRRLFMAGGSDAHGDFNYRRKGWFLRTEDITDTAIGKPRNLVDVGPPSGLDGDRHGQDQVVGAIAAGRFSITDGPALRIAVDQNGSGTIDEEDTAMGGVFELRSGRVLPLLVEWKSTDEFGAVEEIDLYVGVRSSREDLLGNPPEEGRTYAPRLSFREFTFHGPVNNENTGFQESRAREDLEIEDPPFNRMFDNYWEDPTGQLKLDLGEGNFVGTQWVNLDLDRFAVRRDGEDDVGGDRFFVRAFARTERLDPTTCDPRTDIDAANEAAHEGLCVHRYAFTNPIWVIDNTFVCSAEASLDADAPLPSCNAPPALEPPDQPVSFAATARDACDVNVTVSNPQCFSFTKKGKKVSRDCTVTTDGDTVTLVDGGGVASHVQWQVTAVDEAGNTSTATCETQLVRPTR